MGYKLTKDLETGNKVVDNEHKELFKIANHLLDACGRGEPMSSIRLTIEFLLSHVSEHFEHEEQLQKQIGYPDLEQHKAFHEKYRKDLRKILLQIPSTGPTITDITNLNGQLSNLISHVRVDDKKMCEFLKNKNQ